jgi:hypothetical protein
MDPCDPLDAPAAPVAYLPRCLVFWSVATRALCLSTNHSYSTLRRQIAALPPFRHLLGLFAEENALTPNHFHYWD